MTREEAVAELQALKHLFTRIYEGRIEGEALMPILNMAYRKISAIEAYLKEDQSVSRLPEDQLQ